MAIWKRVSREFGTKARKSPNCEEAGVIVIYVENLSGSIYTSTITRACAPIHSLRRMLHL